MLSNRLKKKLTENINHKYKIFLLAFFFLMAVFLTSKIWLPSDVKIQNSDIGTARNTTTGTEIVLKSWQYNPSASFMEATFSYTDSDSSQSMKFSPVAHTDTNKARALSTSVPYCNNGFLVVQINNVPQNWNVISLWIDSKDEQINLNDTESEVDAESNSEDANVDSIEQGANFFCDTRKVVKNSVLKSQAKLYYSLQSIDNEISADKARIKQLNNNIAAANANIQQLNFDISALKSNQKYQTADEVKQSNSTIQNKNSQISDLKNNIAAYQSNIQNDQQKLQKLHQKWNDTKGGRFKEIDTANSTVAPVSSSPSSAISGTDTSENMTVD